jgi:hypothetical protein
LRNTAGRLDVRRHPPRRVCVIRSTASSITQPSCSSIPGRRVRRPSLGAWVTPTVLGRKRETAGIEVLISRVQPNGGKTLRLRFPPSVYQGVQRRSRRSSAPDPAGIDRDVRR